MLFTAKVGQKTSDFFKCSHKDWGQEMDEIVARNKASSTCPKELMLSFGGDYVATLHYTTFLPHDDMTCGDAMTLLGKRCISTLQIRWKSVRASGAQEGIHLAATKSCLASTNGAVMCSAMIFGNISISALIATVNWYSRHLLASQTHFRILERECRKVVPGEAPSVWRSCCSANGSEFFIETQRDLNLPSVKVFVSWVLDATLCEGVLSSTRSCSRDSGYAISWLYVTESVCVSPNISFSWCAKEQYGDGEVVARTKGCF